MAVKKTIWSIRAKATRKVFGKRFYTKEQAREYKGKRVNPENWEVVKQEVTYSDWMVDDK